MSAATSGATSDLMISFLEVFIFFQDFLTTHSGN
jgi:hypothetical protein